MRQEVQHWDSIKATLTAVTGGAGETGYSPTVAIQRLSDGQFLQAGGGSWGAGYAENTMTAVDGTNFPGLYEYDVPSGQLSYAQSVAGYLMKIEEPDLAILEYVHVVGARSEWDELKADHVVADSFGEGVNVAALDVSVIAALADGIWDESTSGHTTASTFGKLVQVIAGMVQANHRLANPIYDTEYRLISADLIAYPTGADALADTNRLATFSATWTYDVNGNVTSHLCRE